MGCTFITEICVILIVAIAGMYNTDSHFNYLQEKQNIRLV